MNTATYLTATLALAVAGAAHADAALEHAKQVLDGTILFDGHNDLPWAIREHEVAQGDLAKYDFRAFNDAVVQTGGVPMEVLAREIDALIRRHQEV